MPQSLHNHVKFIPGIRCVVGTMVKYAQYVLYGSCSIRLLVQNWWKTLFFEFLTALLAFPRHSWTLPGTPGLSWTLLSSPEFSGLSWGPLDSPEPSGGNRFTPHVPGGADVDLRAPSAPSALEVSGGLRGTHGFCWCCSTSPVCSQFPIDRGSICWQGTRCILHALRRGSLQPVVKQNILRQVPESSAINNALTYNKKMLQNVRFLPYYVLWSKHYALERLPAFQQLHHPHWIYCTD